MTYLTVSLNNRQAFLMMYGLLGSFMALPCTVLFLDRRRPRHRLRHYRHTVR